MELEACLKATKILAKFNRRLEAADFLQNTIYIGIKLEPDREIERLSTLAELYGMIGFKGSAHCEVVQIFVSRNLEDFR